MNSKRLIFSVLLGGAAAGVGYLLLPQPNELAYQTCGAQVPPNGLCKIEGGPIQMSGTPVFLPPKQQAFFPTSADIRFTDAQGVEWIAPSGTLSDGASIPHIFMPVVGDRQSREFLLAAALHDAYCGIGNDALATFQTRSWEDVHRMFFDALVAGGTDPKKARIMFSAVYLGGPRWDDPSRDLSNVPEDALRLELEWCLKWIEKTDPSLLEIEGWMTRRESALLQGEQQEPDWVALGVDEA